MPSPVINKTINVDFTTLTMAQLQAEVQRLALVLDLANSQRREIFRICEMRKALAVSRERVALLSATEKDAFKTVLNEG